MQFEIGDAVIWGKDYSDVGVIKDITDDEMSIQWGARLMKYTRPHWHSVNIVEKNNLEFKTIEVVRLEDYTGTVVEYKGRKYKLSLVE